MQWRKRALALIGVVVVFSMVLTACAAPATPAAPAAAPAAATTAAAAAAATTEAAAAATTEAAAAATTEAAAAPAAASDRAKTLIMDIDGGRLQSVDGVWNPLLPSGRRDQGFHQVCLEPLFILNYQTGEFMPWLGESFKANDKLDEWTLALRKGVTWQDGQPFTADDVVYTIQMMIDHAKDGLDNAGAMKEWVKSVEKVDDQTVKFTLNKPNPRFQLDYFSDRIWGGVNIMPKHIWEKQDPVTFKNYDPASGLPLCTGPYKLTSVNPTEVVWTRDDNWWGAKTGFQPLPKPEKIIWTWAGPEETRAGLMANHQLDSIMDITLGALQALQAKNPNVVTWFKDAPYAWVPDPCSRTLEFNDASGPWADPKMRWALNYIIDRDEIVKVAYEGTTLPSKHFFPAYPPLDRYVGLLDKAGQYTKYPLWTHDVAKGQQMIEAMGYKKNDKGYYEKDGKELTLDIGAHEAFIEMQRAAQVIVEQLQKAGINASTRNVAGATLDDNFANGNFEAQMSWQTCGSVNEPWNSMNQFNAKYLKPAGERADANKWRWQGPNADAFGKITDEIGTLPLGDPKIDDLFVQAMDYWWQDLPVIPITQAKKIVPFDTYYWKGWPTADNAYIHPPTWWQSFHAILPHLEPSGNQ